jgi:competence ComEA-like helix-hairpin-helix protein
MKTLLVCLAPLCFAPYALAQELPDGKGKDKVESVCGACHGLEGVMAMNNTKTAWQDLIEDMRGRGADGSEDDFKTIATYLAKYYGPIVQVNKAAAKDLQEQLDLSGDEAAAIVKYRDANGGIKDWDDLAKVPGLDAKKLEPLKKRLKFA